MESFTSEDARREWRRILDRVQRGEQIEITRYGDPLAVVVPVEWRDKAAAALAAKEPKTTTEHQS
jgi:prevent-host-death family protein